jgi:hypothetical protein
LAALVSRPRRDNEREAAIGQPLRTADIEYVERVGRLLDAGLDLAAARRRAAAELAEERYVRELKKGPSDRRDEHHRPSRTGALAVAGGAAGGGPGVVLRIAPDGAARAPGLALAAAQARWSAINVTDIGMAVLRSHVGA